MESFAAGPERRLDVGEVIEGTLETWVMTWELTFEVTVFNPNVCIGVGKVWARWNDVSMSTAISLDFAGLGLAEANWSVDVEVSLTTQMNSCHDGQSKSTL